MSDQPKGIRDLGRELAFYSLFVYDSRSLSLTELLDFSWYYRMTEFDLEDGELISIPEHIKKDVFEFASLLVNGTIGNLEKIDKVISEHLIKWTLDRLHAADRANLRIAVYALLYRFDIPVEVTIAEANELAEKYSEDNSSNYVNGILNKVKEKYRTNTLLKQPPIKIKRKVVGIKPKPGMDGK